MSKTKYIFISGGVISGLGKGVATASISLLLKSRGFKVAPMKADPYVNIDAGTMNPMEHGEVFVLDDGMETDQDLGHYERFINEPLGKSNYMTTGQVYLSVIQAERSFEFDGKCVEVVPHIPEEIIRRIKRCGEVTNADIVLVEVGGTVGEYQNILFLEANRMMKLKYPQDVLHIHLAYLPLPPSIGELKSKPVQTSVRLLNSVGISPDFILARAEKPIDTRRADKLATFCGVDPGYIIGAPDVENIYDIPLNFEEQGLSGKILNKLSLKPRKTDLSNWEKVVEKAKEATEEIKIALVGKYFATGDYTLEDSYISVIESLKHASWYYSLKPRLFWVDSEKIEKEGVDKLREMDGIVVPGGFGSRGIDGILQAITFARENKKPYFGLCYGLQLATVEFARNVAGLKNANTAEVDPKTSHPVIHVMSDQEKKLLNREYGGTMRLGAWHCKIKKGTKAFQIYRKEEISERHRHRYEVNNKYRGALEKEGLIFSATTTDDRLVEMIELVDHPFFVGTQFHPEFKTRFLEPHPLYRAFIQACSANKKVSTKNELPVEGNTGSSGWAL